MSISIISEGCLRLAQERSDAFSKIQKKGETLLGSIGKAIKILRENPGLINFYDNSVSLKDPNPEITSITREEKAMLRKTNKTAHSYTQLLCTELAELDKTIEHYKEVLKEEFSDLIRKEDLIPSENPINTSLAKKHFSKEINYITVHEYCRAALPIFFAYRQYVIVSQKRFEVLMSAKVEGLGLSVKEAIDASDRVGFSAIFWKRKSHL